MSASAEAVNEATRKPVHLVNRIESNAIKSSTERQLWYEANADVERELLLGILQRLPNLGYKGVVLSVRDLELATKVPRSMRLIVKVTSETDVVCALEAIQSPIIVSADGDLLDKARTNNLETCLYQFVDDGDSLRRAIELGLHYPYVMIRFRDPTNIPLELVIASLQPTGTVLIKEINEPNDVADAVVALGVMEIGADGVMYSPRDHTYLDLFAQGLEARKRSSIAIETATITRSVPVGMGYRSCIDLATLFNEDEGMLVGSTSQGGILCCPEVFYLPYMETRPFRINAGAVHSYVFNHANRTDYMTELKVGTSVLIIDLAGQTRSAPVGRIKTEMRPLRLIEAQFASGEMINVLMQDDWHVRVFSAEGRPLNVTELKNGDRVLAHKNDPGRHVGIKITEKILEK
jgi:3-dehydroquinate synthase II/3-amino-4-hydroxybenzoic acid synthase